MLFRREIIFPLLVVGFVSASAHATRDELSAQAAADLRCNSVSITRSTATQFLAVGCGRERTYTCDQDDVCTSDDAPPTRPTHSDSDGDDEAADAFASAMTEMACACASAGLASHGSHSSSHASKKKK